MREAASQSQSAIGSGAWFFDDATAVQKLRTEAVGPDGKSGWLDTPYFKFSCVKGRDGGVDCAGLPRPLFVAAGLGASYLDAGLLFEFQRTSADYQSHRTMFRILRLLRGEMAAVDPQSAALAEIFAELELPKESLCNLPPERFMPGDLLVLRQGGQFHLPIVLDGRVFIHCFSPGGVQLGDIHDPTFSKHLDAHFRARAIPSVPSVSSC